jgi:hypothetical protein
LSNSNNTNARWSKGYKVMANFNLAKEVQRARFVIEKRKIPSVRAHVGFSIDVSQSMQGLFDRGVVQEAVQRVLPIAVNFDDNGAVDVFTFSSGSNMARSILEVTADNFDGFVDREIVQNPAVPKWSGTDYCPVLELNLRHYGFRRPQNPQGVPPSKPAPRRGFMASLNRMLGRESVSSSPTTTWAPHLQSGSNSGFPVVNYFVTDGANDDQADTDRLLHECQTAHANIYFLFMGIGNTTFPFLERVARDYSNVGFLKVSDLASLVNDDDVYENLLPEELGQWLQQK